MFTRSIAIALVTLSWLSVPSFAAEGDPVRPEPTVVSTTVPYTAPTTDPAKKSDETPKNVIYFIGDGTGPAAVAAGRSATVGPAGRLHVDTMPVVSFVTTHSADAAVTDSAAGGTALASGQKTLNGAVGVLPDGSPVETLCDWAQALGKSTGIMTTERITGATPASFYAHVSKRGQTIDIAAQAPTSKVDIFIGGGMGVFSEEVNGTTQRAEAEKNGYVVVDSVSALNEAVKQDKPVMALLSKDAFPPASERDFTLAELVRAAIEKLSKDDDGFFLMVEGAQIDWAAHDNQAQHMVNEFADFDMAIGEALKFANSREDTLVLMTADHETGGVTLPKAPGVEVGKLGDEGYTPSVGVAYSTGSHTGIMVPLFVAGASADHFGGVRDNTSIALTIRSLWNVHD